MVARTAAQARSASAPSPASTKKQQPRAASSAAARGSSCCAAWSAARRLSRSGSRRSSQGSAGVEEVGVIGLAQALEHGVQQRAAGGLAFAGAPRAARARTRAPTRAGGSAAARRAPTMTSDLSTSAPRWSSSCPFVDGRVGAPRAARPPARSCRRTRRGGGTPPARARTSRPWLHSSAARSVWWRARRVARAAGEQAQALVEPLAHAVDAEQRHARGRQLDRQRDAVERGGRCSITARDVARRRARSAGRAARARVDEQRAPRRSASACGARGAGGGHASGPSR